MFSNIFDPVAIYRVVKNDGEYSVVFRDVNPAYEHNNRVKREDVIGRTFRDVWHNSEQGWLDLVHNVARTRQTSNYEGYSVVTGRYLHAFAFMPFDDDVVVIFSDLTEAKRIENELLDYRRRVKEYAARLSIAEEKTRRDISVVLHDRIGYSLISTLQKLRALKASTAENAPRVDEIISEVEDLLDRTRSFTFEISSPLLYEVGLEAAVERLMEHTFAKTDIVWDFRYAQDLSLDKNVSILLYRIVHELLVNIVKHATATRVYVRFKRGKTGAHLVVDDDGKGFEPGLSENYGIGRGLGLLSVNETLHSIGGSMKIISQKGRGSVITIHAPASIAMEGSEANGHQGLSR
ncbi:PAS domain-containing protein [Synergistaceae bacterium OttesenSCG-928-I11]|nr:PAS domain-containing protein [Synergistaceae bacterium OttesenSCG-928-I11]